MKNFLCETMNHIYEIKFFRNSFVVIERRQELKFGGLKQIEVKWRPPQLLSDLPYNGCSESEIASWNRCREWLKTHYPELLL